MSDPAESQEPLRTCAFSGEQRTESQMVRIGGHYIAIEHKDAAVQFLQQGNEFEMPLPPGSLETPVKLWPMLVRSWELFRRHGLLLVVLDLTVSLPVNLLDSFLLMEVFSEENALNLFSTFVFTFLIAGTLSFVGTAAVMQVLSKTWGGGRTSYREAWQETFHRLGAALSAGFLSMFLFLVGFALCILPGFAVLTKLTFALCFVMDVGHSGVQSLSSSARLTDGRFWLVLGCMVAVSAALMVPSIVYAVVFEFLPSSWQHWEIDGVLNALLYLPMVFTGVFTFVFYKALRAASPPAMA